MSGSVEYRLTAEPTRFTFGAPTATTQDRSGPIISFKLAILFLLVLYSNIGRVYPALDAFRPALAVAAAAIVMMAVELALTRKGFRLSWPQGYLLLVFLGVAIISSFGAIYSRKAFETTSDLSKVLLIYLLLENTLTSARRVRLILWTLVIGGLFPAFGTMYNYSRGILVEHTRGGWIGIFKNPNECAYALVLLVPIAVTLTYGSKRIVQWGLWGIIAAYFGAIYLTFSRGGLIALFAVMALIGWKQKSSLIRTLIMGALALGLVAVALFWNRKDDFKDLRDDTTVNQRIATIKAGSLMFLDKPLLGVGPGCSMVAYPLYVPKDAHCGCQDQLVIHNAFIQILSELGILGFAPFIGLIGITLFQLWRAGNFAEIGGQTPNSAALGNSAVLETWQRRRIRSLSPDLPEIPIYARGLELSLWGFVIAGMSGGFSYTWFPYILVGVAVATLQLCRT